MAERRMFSKLITDSDLFLDMPQSTQLLYFHISMHGDDDGFINNPKSIMRNAGCRDDDMKILIAKQFIIPFESGVIVIKHWKIHNYIRSDRYNETKCPEKSMIETLENKEYQLKKAVDGIPVGIPMVDKLDTQVRLGKDSIGKDSIEQYKKNKRVSPKEKYSFSDYTTNNDLIVALNDFVLMRKKIKAPMTEKAVRLMLSRLEVISNSDEEKIAILNQSIMNSWKGVFELKDNSSRGRKQGFTQEGHKVNDYSNEINF